MKVEIKTTKERVTALLKKHNYLKDNDDKLIANIWHGEIKAMGLNPKTLSAFDFLEVLSEGKLTNAESCRRCRQSIQESDPSLRGEKYSLRHGNTGNIKEQLGY